MTGKVTLRDLTKENWEQVVKLKVRADQADFVAPNVYTIAETRFYPTSTCRVILANGKIVGFAAYGIYPDDNKLWLHRLMIDADHQGKGYGRSALRALIKEWESRYPDRTEVQLGYAPSNVGAERLYVSEGFVPGEIADWGERIARRSLQSLDQGT